MSSNQTLVLPSFITYTATSSSGDASVGTSSVALTPNHIPI
ncbi:MAG: hypothetical protein NTV09_13790 [Bacteroidetes bacterium]|nr:hypothetical protein [Bacteroidota bacterium]